MLNDDLPAAASGSEDSGVASQPPAVGRILYERFLVDRDLTDHSLSSRFSVYRVRDLKNFCQEVVLKILNIHTDDPEGTAPSFHQVCETLIQLRHPNIEEILETGRLYDQRPYAISRFHTGVRLSQLIGPAGRFELEAAARVVEQAAEALAAAHSKKMLHCDLRPSNLIVPQTDGSFQGVRLINFGSAWPVDVRGESLANVTSGSESLQYAAPELHAKLGHRSPASDIFSLAVLAFRLITGRMPFSSDPAKLIEMISLGEVEPPTACRTDLSYETENLILTGLRFEPAWRPQNTEDFGYRLARSMRTSPRLPLLRTAALADAVQQTSFDAPDEPEPLIFIEEEIMERPAVRIRRTPSAVSDRALAWSLIILLLAGALSLPIGQTLLNADRTNSAVSSMLQRSPEDQTRHQLKYGIVSQRPNISRSPEALPATPSISSGARLDLVSDTAGDAYVFNEVTDQEGRISYQLIFPAANAAGLEAGKAVQTPLVGLKDSEALWIVWTAVRNDDLDALKNAAGEGSTLNESESRRLRHFLERNRNLRVEITGNDSTGQTVLNGSGDRIVHRIDLGEG